MPYTTPKVNWNNSNAAVGTDFNRIEGNALANHVAILQEVTDRQNAISAEAYSRSINDGVLQLNIDSIIDNIGNASGNIPISNGAVCTDLVATRAVSAVSADYSGSAGVASDSLRFAGLSYGERKRFLSGIEHSSTLKSYIITDFGTSVGSYLVSGACFIGGVSYICSRIWIYYISGVGTIYNLFAMNTTTGSNDNILSLPIDTDIIAQFSW